MKPKPPSNWALNLSRCHTPTSGQANLYGVILYTKAHPYIAKVLADKDFWGALDEISGPQWAIFATKGAQGRRVYPDLGPQTVGFIVPVYEEPSENKELVKAFGLDNTESLPLLVIFAEDKDGSVVQANVSLQNSNQDDAYKSLRSIFETIAEALRHIDKQNLQAGAKAFHAVSYAVKNYKERQLIKKVIRGATSIFLTLKNLAQSS